MSKPLSQILHWKALTGIVRTPAGGVPADLLPPGFLNLTRPVSGHQATWDVLATSRQVAKGSLPGSPSVRRKAQTIGTNAATLPRFAEHLMIEGEGLQNLRGLGGEAKQEKGREYVDFQVADQGQIFSNTRTTMIYSILKLGAVYLQDDGSGGYDLLPSSSNADITIDMQVPAANKNQFGGTLTDWSVTSTDIIAEIQGTLELARKTTGIPLRHVFYGPNIRGYLAANDDIQQVLKTDSAMGLAIRQGSIPDGFGDQSLMWHPLQQAFFNDKDGTNQDWFSGDEVVFTPEPERGWYEMIEGSELLPTGSFGAHGTAGDALSASTEVFGRGSYAKLEDDPLQIKVVSVDNVLPTLKVPSAVFLGDCTA